MDLISLKKAAIVSIVVILVSLVTLVAPAAASDPAGIDLDTANRMLRGYAEHVMRRLPRDWRQAVKEQIRESPPKVTAEGVYKLDSPQGRIAFEYDAKEGHLLCDAYVHGFRNRPHAVFGLSREEVVAALQAEALRGTPTGGGEVFLDTVADGIYLRRAYGREVQKKQLAKELDALTKAGNAWSYDHYIEALRRYAAGMVPPESASAADGDFEVTLVLTQDPSTMEAWKKAPGTRMPDPITRSKVEQSKTMIAVVLFSGATLGEDGRARVEGTFHADYPSGEPAAWNLRQVHWDRPLAPPPGHVQHGERNVTLTFDHQQPLGEYVIRGEVCDSASGRCVEVRHPFELVAPN